MKIKQISLETLIFALAFLLGLFLRIIALGKPLFSEAEAFSALQAHKLALGGSASVEGLYTVLTAGLFSVFHSSEMLGRLIPAVSGSLLVLLPWFFRRQTGQVPALILAFLLALDPALVASARMSDSFSLAISAVSLAALGLGLRRPVLTGLALGLGLLSGPWFWFGAVGLGLAVLWQWLAHRRTMTLDFSGFAWKNAAGAALGAVFFIGTLFFHYPNGLSGVSAGLVSFFAGWSAFQGATLVMLLAGLLFCETLALILGLAGLAVGLREENPWQGLWWRIALVMLALLVIYPGRQVIGLAWVSLGLLPLAATALAGFFRRSDVNGWVTAAVFAATLLMLGFSWINMAGYFSAAGGVDLQQVRLLSVLGGVMMTILVALLVAWGWSMEGAMRGLGMGATVVLVVFSLASTWRATGLGSKPALELWRTQTTTVEADLLQQTLRDFSFQQEGFENTLDITVVDVPSPALEWLLRDWQEVQLVSGLAAGSRPSMVLTTDQQPGWGADYTGQDFVWFQRPSWNLLLAREWMKWAIFRDALQDRQTLVLWVRADLFAGSSASAAPTE